MFSVSLNYLLTLNKPPNTFSLTNISKASEQTNKNHIVDDRIFHIKPCKTSWSLSHDPVTCCRVDLSLKMEEFRLKHTFVGICNSHFFPACLRLTPYNLLVEACPQGHAIALPPPSLSGCELTLRSLQ